MPLDDNEQKILEEIERQFYDEDPDLARAVRDIHHPSRFGVRSSLLGVVAGLVIVIAFFASIFSPAALSARVQHHAFILPTPDVLQRLVEVLLARLNRSRLLLVARQVRVNQLNQTVEVLGRHLRRVSTDISTRQPSQGMLTDSFC